MKWIVVIVLALLLVSSVGAMGDRTIYYPLSSSTPMNISYFKIGNLTSYTNFDSNGFQTMVGNARPWRDAITDSISIKNTGTPGLSINAVESTLDYIHTAGLTDYAYFNIQLNHDRDLTSKVYPHIHFFASEQSVVPNFLIQYRWQMNAKTKVTPWTNYKCNSLLTPSPSAGVTTMIITGNTSGISPPVGTGPSDIIQMRVIRDHSNGSGLFGGDDPYTATVGVVSIDIHFMIDSLGSTSEITK